MFWIAIKAEPRTREPRAPRNYRFSILTLLLLMIPIAVASITIRNHYLESIDDWNEYSNAKLETHLSYGRPVIVFVGADWDAASTYIELMVLKDPEVTQRLRDNGYAKLYADITRPSKNSSDALTKLGHNSSPAVAIFQPKSPDTPTVFIDAIRTKELLLKLGEAAATKPNIPKP